MMFEYKFERVEMDLKFWTQRYEPVGDHHRVIREHGEQGWRLVDVLSVQQDIEGCSRTLEMIFERPKANDG